MTYLKRGSSGRAMPHRQKGILHTDYGESESVARNHIISHQVDVVANRTSESCPVNNALNAV